MRNQERLQINPIFWLKYSMSARQMVLLASQGNKIIQKHQKQGPLTVLYHLKQHFQASGWSSNSASIETGQKVHWRNRLGKAKKLFHNLTEWSTWAIKKVWPRFALKNSGNSEQIWNFLPSLIFFASVFIFLPALIWPLWPFFYLDTKGCHINNWQQFKGKNALILLKQRYIPKDDSKCIHCTTKNVLLTNAFFNFCHVPLFVGLTIIVSLFFACGWIAPAFSWAPTETVQFWTVKWSHYYTIYQYRMDVW